MNHILIKLICCSSCGLWVPPFRSKTSGLHSQQRKNAGNFSNIFALFSWWQPVLLGEMPSQCCLICIFLLHSFHILAVWSSTFENSSIGSPIYWLDGFSCLILGDLLLSPMVNPLPHTQLQRFSPILSAISPLWCSSPLRSRQPSISLVSP